MSSKKTYPLHRLIPYKNAAKLKQLFEKATYDMNEKDDNGRPLVTYAAEIEDNDEVLDIIFERPKLDVAVEDGKRNTMLHYLALNGNLTFIERLFERFPTVEVDPCNEFGDTPLIMAAKTNRMDVIKFLHEKGANLDHQNKNGSTALHCSASNGYTNITRFLVSLGAKLTSGEKSEVPVDWGFDDINSIFFECEKYPVHEAVLSKNTRKAAKLLENGYHDVNEKDDYGKTVLFVAAEQEDELLFDLLLQINADISIRDREDRTIFHILATRRDLKWVQKLNAFAGVSVDVEDAGGNTPLIVAAKHNNHSVVEYLQNKGADINWRNKRGFTALHFAAMNGHLQTTRALMRLGAQLSVPDNYGCTPLTLSMHWGFPDVTEILRTKDLFPLHSMVTYRNKRKVEQLLKSETFDVTETNDDGRTAFLAAAEKDDNEILELLIDKSWVDPSVGDKAGYTALHVLTLNGNLDIIDKMFKKFPGMDVDIQNSYKETPLLLAAKMDHANLIEYLFQKGAKLDHQNDKQYAAIHYAANNACMESIKLLVELGAEIDIKDSYGSTPVILASNWGFYEIVDYLTSNNVTRQYINRHNNYGHTALWKAVQRGHYDTARLLLQKGAEVNTRQHPLDKACLNQDTDMARLLINGGADIELCKNYTKKYLNTNQIC